MSAESKEDHRKTLGKVGGLNSAYFEWKARKRGHGSDGKSDAGTPGNGKRKSRKAKKWSMAFIKQPCGVVGVFNSQNFLLYANICFCAVT